MLASAILGNTVSHFSLGTGISLSATQNNYLTHEQYQLFLSQMAAAKSQKERNDIQEYWLSVDRELEIKLINKIENEYYQNASYRNNLNLYSLIRKHIHQYREKIGVVNPTYGFIYTYYNSDGREVNDIIIRGTIGRE